MTRLRLYARYRPSNGGYYVASVPMKRLVKLAGYGKLRWSFRPVDDKGAWLILEAY